MLLPLLFNLNTYYLHEAEGSGGLVLGGTALVRGPFEIQAEFTWQVGEAIERFFRVETKCVSFDCDTTGLETDQECKIEIENINGQRAVFNEGNKFIVNVFATSVAEVCQKLREREFIVPIKSIHVYSRPAFKSDRELLESQGADFSCNELIPVPFCTQEECLEFCLDFDLEVNAIAEITGGFAYSYTGTGGLTLGGTATVTSPRYSYIGSGGLVLSGTAAAGLPSGLGELTVEAVAESVLESWGATFGTIDGDPLDPSDAVVTTACECVPLPVILQLQHDINRSNAFTDFLNRNDLFLDSSLLLRYNGVSKTWQHNSQFIGIGRDGLTEERWRLILEWSCTNNLGSFDLGDSTVWKFAMYVEKKNLATNIDFDTRVLVAFPPQGVCVGDFGLDWHFRLNTQNLFVETDNPTVFVDYKILEDGIGLFKSQSWLDDPILKIGVSQLTNQNGQQLFDIKPIFPSSERKLLGDGIIIQNAFIPVVNN